jgi:hypothetical protein
MICPKCEAEIPQHSTFCLRCGSSLNVAPRQSLTPVLGIALGVLIGVVILIVSVTLFFLFGGGLFHGSNVGSTPAPTFTSPLRPQSKDLIAGAFTVGANNNYAIPFTVEQSSYQGKVIGKFTARGGKNDINVMVMSQDDYVNYTDHNQYRIFYESGFVTVGRLNVSLTSGSYYLVFDNQPALITSKAVEAYVELRYE